MNPMRCNSLRFDLLDIPLGSLMYPIPQAKENLELGHAFSSRMLTFQGI